MWTLTQASAQLLADAAPGVSGERGQSPEVEHRRVHEESDPEHYEEVVREPGGCMVVRLLVNTRKTNVRKKPVGPGQPCYI